MIFLDLTEEAIALAQEFLQQSNLPPRVLTLWKKAETIFWQDLCQTKGRVKEAVQNVF